MSTIDEKPCQNCKALAAQYELLAGVTGELAGIVLSVAAALPNASPRFRTKINALMTDVAVIMDRGARLAERSIT